MSDDAALLSPLHSRHEALGAKFGDFGGWSMPLEYAGGGVVAEHTAVREHVGVFDVSHLGKARVVGPGAAAYLDSVLTNALDRIAPGKAQYTLLCDDSGGVIDDLIAYLVSDEWVFLIPNAANTTEVLEVLADGAPDGVDVVNLHRDFAVLAVQGPDSPALLADLGLPTDMDYMAFRHVEHAGFEMTVCRTGYTGEVGFELVVPWDEAGRVWDELLSAGAAYGVRPCGLGARDTLRTEMGYPLHGQDLSRDITPVQARAGWAVGWSKPAFHGRDALIAEKEAGPARRSVGLVSLDRAIPRAHMVVTTSDGAPIGEVTSGTFSPTRKVGIALALVATAAGLSEGDEVLLDVRGRPARFAITAPPFVQTSVR
ncbi:MAG TPA: glycine cleavage system aminomethyltransferase GcvT [Candidatus Nanopelagicales bacterium]|nr:glycine cleavage system aminomethyltransferase GcvT [Candidatus Nanopelagicales bacterium]